MRKVKPKIKQNYLNIKWKKKFSPYGYILLIIIVRVTHNPVPGFEEVTTNELVKMAIAYKNNGVLTPQEIASLQLGGQPVPIVPLSPRVFVILI